VYEREEVLRYKMMGWIIALKSLFQNKPSEVSPPDTVEVSEMKMRELQEEEDDCVYREMDRTRAYGMITPELEEQYENEIAMMENPQHYVEREGLGEHVTIDDLSSNDIKLEEIVPVKNRFEIMDLE
jgi:hypothetical protein